MILEWDGENVSVESWTNTVNLRTKRYFPLMKKCTPWVHAVVLTHVTFDVLQKFKVKGSNVKIRGVKFESRPLQKFAKSSITQRQIDRSRSNFVRWLVWSHDTRSMFKVNGSKVKVTAWQHISIKKSLHVTNG